MQVVQLAFVALLVLVALSVGDAFRMTAGRLQAQRG
jgi:hypothetical protein